MYTLTKCVSVELVSALTRWRYSSAPGSPCDFYDHWSCNSCQDAQSWVSACHGTMPCLSPKAKSFLAALPWKTDLAGRDIGVLKMTGEIP